MKYFFLTIVLLVFQNCSDNPRTDVATYHYLDTYEAIDVGFYGSIVYKSNRKYFCSWIFISTARIFSFISKNRPFFTIPKNKYIHIMVRKISLICVCFLLYSCFPSIHNKKQLFSKDELGINGSSFKTEGYYYRVLNDTLYYKHNLKNDGTYEKDKSFYYQLKRLRSLFFTKDGFVIQKDFTTPYVYNLDSVKHYNENLVSIFEKKITKNEKIEGIVKESDTWFFNKKAQIWNNGVYRIKGDSIDMQLYENALGDYYLVEYSGFLQNNSIIYTKEYAHKEKKSYRDTICYQFKKYELRKIQFFLKENTKKFWK